MKPKNPVRNWALQFWGVEDDQYHHINFRGTLEDALAKADEEECEVDWEVVRMSFAALG